MGYEHIVLPPQIQALPPGQELAGPVWTVAGRIDRSRSRHDGLLGDRDGVVIIPAGIAEAMVSKTEQIVATESDMRRALASGMDLVEAYWKFGKF